MTSKNIYFLLLLLIYSCFTEIWDKFWHFWKCRPPETWHVCVIDINYLTNFKTYFRKLLNTSNSDLILDLFVLKDIMVNCLLWIILTVIFDLTLELNDHESKFVCTLCFFYALKVTFWDSEVKLSTPWSYHTIIASLKSIWDFFIWNWKKLTTKKDVDQGRKCRHSNHF